MNPVCRLVFLGSSGFAVPALEALIGSKQFSLLAVFTQPDRLAGRHLHPSPTPVKLAAVRHDLSLHQPENVNAEEPQELLRKLQPDLLVTVAYGQKLNKAVRETALHGAINLHPSLLPELRGAAPIPFALWEGKAATGLTIFKLTTRMDAGPVYFQRQVDIFPNENSTGLSQRLAQSGALCLLEFLRNWTERPWEPVPQEEARATYCRKLEKADLNINWNSPASTVLNHIRALALEPGASTRFRGRQLKILAAELCPGSGSEQPGTVTAVAKNQGFSVLTGSGGLLIKTVQPAGKQAMPAWAFHLGARIVPGERLGDHA